MWLDEVYVRYVTWFEQCKPAVRILLLYCSAKRTPHADTVMTNLECVDHSRLCIHSADYVLLLLTKTADLCPKALFCTTRMKSTCIPCIPSRTPVACFNYSLMCTLCSYGLPMNWELRFNLRSDRFPAQCRSVTCLPLPQWISTTTKWTFYARCTRM